MLADRIGERTVSVGSFLIPFLHEERAFSTGAAAGVLAVLSAVGVVCPITFAALVAATSWRTGFALVALCPLAGAAGLRRLDV